MSSSAGWYPDPGGQPGLYRYWTGSSWTETVTTNPQGTPPPASSGPAPAPGYPQSGYPQGGFTQAGSPQTGTPQGGPPQAGHPQGGSAQAAYGAGGYPAGGTRRRSNVGWWIGGLAVLVAIVVVVVFVVQGMGGTNGPLIPLPGQPTSTVTPNICPPASTSTPTAPANTPGWVTGGKLAYPALGSPWEDSVDNRVPWGSLASVQQVTDQEDYDGKGNSWVASILVSDLFVGDGFASTKVASETVLKCVLGKYYADTVVTQTPISSARHDVGGHSGWLIETQLGFNIPGLNTKGERVLLLVVQTSDADYGLFYASVPDTLSELLPDARTAMAGLKVLG